MQITVLTQHIFLDELGLEIDDKVIIGVRIPRVFISTNCCPGPHGVLPHQNPSRATRECLHAEIRGDTSVRSCVRAASMTPALPVYDGLIFVNISACVCAVPRISITSAPLHIYIYGTHQYFQYLYASHLSQRPVPVSSFSIFTTIRAGIPPSRSRPRLYSSRLLSDI